MKINYSIIIPVYNKKTSLPLLLSQINAISYKEFEVIFIDDGSCDESYELLSEFKKTAQTSVTVIKQKNAGPGAARNKGLQIAKGKYVWFIDSDDILNPGAFNIFDTLIKRAKTPDIICFDHVRISDYTYADTFTNSTEPEYITMSQRYALLFESVAPWSKIFNTVFLKKNEILFPNLYFAEDFYYTRHAFCCAKSVIHTKEILYKYCVNPNSISHTHYNTHSSDFIKICKNLYKLAENHPEYKEELYYNICEHTRNYVSNMAEPENYSKEIIELNEFITQNRININTYEHLETQINSKYTSSVRWKITEPLSKIKKFLGK